MAKNKKNQPAAVRFGPALKAAMLCLLIGGSAVGYVWQKTQIYELGKQIRARDAELAKLRDANKQRRDQLAMLRSPGKLDERVRELKLGLTPAQPAQVWRLAEPHPGPAVTPAKPPSPYVAQRTRGAERPE